MTKSGTATYDETTGELQCTDCNGTGFITCPECHGAAADENRTDDCDYCCNTGEDNCPCEM